MLQKLAAAEFYTTRYTSLIAGKTLVLPLSRNANPFGSNKAISGPMKLVSGLN